MNNGCYTGRLVRTPALHRTASGVAVIAFTLAVDRRRPTKDGKWLTDFIDFVAWRGLAEKVCKYQKGDMLEAIGPLEIHPYTDKDGKNIYRAEVVADYIRKISSPKSSNENAVPSAPHFEEDYQELPEEPGEEFPF